MASKILFYVAYGFMWLLAWLPFSILYLLSDLFYFVVYHILRYRRKVVHENISNAFPNFSSNEIKALERKFYHQLCDLVVEIIKYINISPKEIKKRAVFKNLHLFNEAKAQNKNVIALFGHNGNWEWISSLPLTSPKEITVGTLYRPLKNPHFDNFFVNLRSHFNCECVPKNNVLRYMFSKKKENQPFILAFIADQSPSKNNLHYWTNFLNQPTPFLTGWEAIARKSNDAVLYLSVKKIKRGYYEYTMEPLCFNPKTTQEFELTEQYARRIEQEILENPALWLWSHNRWKHKHLYKK